MLCQNKFAVGICVNRHAFQDQTLLCLTEGQLRPDGSEIAEEINHHFL